MKNKLLLAVMLLFIAGLGYAQDSGSQSTETDYGPQAGQKTAAIIFGRGNFISSGLSVPGSPTSVYWIVPGNAPSANMVESNNNDVSNMVGIEGRYFFTDRIAVKLSGGAIFRNTPSVVNIPGSMDPNAPNSAWIPHYQAVVQDNSADININLGGEYHFTTSVSRLFPYVGITVPFFYGRRSVLDPTIGGDYDDIQPDDPTFIRDIGLRHVEVRGFGTQAVGGIDYYLAEGFYFGFEIKPVSYIYLGSSKYPAPGLDALNSENGTLSFFTQPFMKVGFKF
jgi:outer membrane protein W